MWLIWVLFFYLVNVLFDWLLKKLIACYEKVHSWFQSNSTQSIMHGIFNTYMWILWVDCCDGNMIFQMRSKLQFVHKCQDMWLKNISSFVVSCAKFVFFPFCFPRTKIINSIFYDSHATILSKKIIVQPNNQFSFEKPILYINSPTMQRFAIWSKRNQIWRI
jgi:hypothetical protein